MVLPDPDADYPWPLDACPVLPVYCCDYTECYFEALGIADVADGPPARLNTVDCLSSKEAKLCTKVPSSNHMSTWLQMKHKSSTMLRRNPIFIFDFKEKKVLIY